MRFDRRTFLAASAASAAMPSPGEAQAQPVLRPEDFGAQADGTTNDTPAFARLSTAINRLGGGTISLAKGRTYAVGDQHRSGGYAWTPAPVIELAKLSAPLRIIGNGARLKCRAGLRFGTFDVGTDQPVRRSQPNGKVDELASPYRGLIYIRGCTAPISILDIELDGNLPQLRIGGPFGDTGWQVPATGLLLEGNLAEELIANIYTHHHGQDGLMIIGDDRRTARSRFTRVVSQFNGRQGLSLTGGRGYDFEDCEFSRTGRSVLSSAPAAGVDLEAEVGTIRDVTFTRCKFVDNSGVGLLAEAGDVAGVRFSECLFVGTTSWSAWPRKPHMVFDGCTFAGSVVNAFPNVDASLAARFLNCNFVDDPALSPTGKLFFGAGPIANLGESDNVLFSGCKFDLRHQAVLPWSWRASYYDCTMRQVSGETAQTKGKYTGRNLIDGPVDLYGSMVLGSVLLNGKLVPEGAVGADVKPWA